MEKHVKLLREEIEQSETKLKHSKKWSRKTNIEQKKDWATITLDEMGLSSRAYFGLNHQKIHNLYDLSKYSHEDLMRIRHMGETTVKEIEEKAAKFGLHIRQS